jgi:hypothetical protein
LKKTQAQKKKTSLSFFTRSCSSAFSRAAVGRGAVHANKGRITTGDRSAPRDAPDEEKTEKKR